MSTELSPKKLTIQNVFIITFIAAALLLVGGYVYTVGYTDDFVQNMVQMAFGILLIGLGAALARVKLGRNGNGATPDPI